MSKQVVGFILAGGQSRRMGAQDKCLLPLGDKTVLDHVIAKARPQVDTLVLNANGDPGRFKIFDLPVVPDVINSSSDQAYPNRFLGPLAGILTGMAWIKDNAPSCDWLATFPADSPFIPVDLVQRLFDATTIPGNQLACAKSIGRCHFTTGLWPVALYESLKEALVAQGVRKTGYWLRQHQYGCAEYPNKPFDPFLNINYPEDLQAAQRIIEGHPD